MKIYTVHVRAAGPAVFEREGFAWGAFWLGPLWLLWRRAWLGAALAVVALALPAIAPAPLRPAIILGVLLMLGLVARDVVRWSLGRRGYQLAHVVAGRNADDAFLRLLDHAPAMAPG